MPVDAISEESLQRALRDIRAGRSLSRSPLLELDLLTLALRQEGLSDNPRTREWQLGVALENAVLEAIAERTGSQASPRPLAAADLLACLRQAFQSGRSDVEALAYLHTRYFSRLTDQLPVTGIAEALGVTDRTLQNRLRLGHRLLAEVLREREVRAGQALGAQPPSAGLSAAGNLPTAATVLLARDGELAELEHLLERARLVTIVGPGGVGKTRLALELARRVSGEYVNGTWFADLAYLPPGAGVAEEVGALFGLRREAHAVPEAAIVDHLRGLQALLVLDNCEHVIEASARLASAILRGCRHARLVATSREALRVGGEVVYQLAPLAAPGELATTELEPDAVAEYPAVRLFEERARLVQGGFRLSRENAAHVARICREVDGLPLAIEMAAALVRTLTPAQVVGRMLDRLLELRGDRRDAVPHHASLRATMEWSFSLLTSAEQALFARLSVFGGSWSLEAAESICAGNGIERADVVPLATALVDKSLLVVDTRGRSARYTMLSTVHQFAAGKLAASGDEAEWRDRHLWHYLAMAEEAAPALDGPRGKPWLERLDQEHASLRRALHWALDQGRAEPAIRLAAALWRFWYLRGHWEEGQRLLDRAIEANQPLGDSPAAARALTARGHLASASGDQPAAARWCEQGAAMSRRLADQPGTAMALNVLGMIAHRRGNREAARRHYEASLAVCRSIGDEWGASTALNNLGLVAWRAGDDDGALAHYEEALAISRRIGDLGGGAAVQMNMAGILRTRGESESAQALCQEALELFEQAGDVRGQAMALHNLGSLAAEGGELDRARLLYERSLAMRRAMADRPGTVSSACALSGVCIEQGDLRAAGELLAECLDMCTSLVDDRFTVEVIEGLARLAAAKNDARRLAALVGCADAVREAVGDARPPDGQAWVDTALATARTRLGAAALERHLAAGRQMSLAEAARLARAIGRRENDDPPSGAAVPAAKRRF